MNLPTYIIGNWKMNTSHESARALTLEVADVMTSEDINVECVLCPPTVWLAGVTEWAGDACKTGAQDCHDHDAGAFTGDISAAMIKEAGASYVIVGHSERRQYHQESDEQVKRKATAALSHGLIPVVCVGESLADYESSRTIEVVETQVLGSLPDNQNTPVIVAYEPVWAIGSGHVPTLDEISVVHSAIIATLEQKKGLDIQSLSVLYGGSVKSANAKDILSVEGVGGVLVGGASLKAEEFCGILRAA